MSTSRTLRIAAASACVAVCACNENTDRVIQTADGSVPAASRTAAPRDRDPCSLITKEEAEAILGATFNVTREDKVTGGGPPSCEYTPAGSKKLNGFALKVYWTGGKDALATTKSGTRIAKALMKTSQTDPMGLMTIEPVDDLGDEAYFNPVLGSSVLKDDTLLEFDINAMMWHQPSREAGLELWKQLVNKALARL
jgi:hypothetical protein